MEIPNYKNKQDHLNAPDAGIQSEHLRPWLYKPKNSKFGTKRDKKFNDRHWSSQENMKYVHFLVQFRHLLDASAVQKRKHHLNRMMSKHIGTRSPTQCRSHHQQMMKCFHDIDSIVKEVQLSLKDRKESTSETAENRIEPIETVSELDYKELRNKHLLWTPQGATFFDQDNFYSRLQSLEDQEAGNSNFIDDFLN